MEKMEPQELGLGLWQASWRKGGREQARAVQSFRSCAQLAGHCGGGCLAWGAQPILSPARRSPSQSGDERAAGLQLLQPGAMREPKRGPLQAVPSGGRPRVGEPGADERSSNQGPLSRPEHSPVPGAGVPPPGGLRRDLLRAGRRWRLNDRLSDLPPRPGRGVRCVRARAPSRVSVRPGAHAAHPRRGGWPARAPFPALSAAARPAAACRCSALQEQKGELRKRLSYTTHKLEKLETEFDSTRHYLEIELRRAQEELEKVTEKLRRYGGAGPGVGRQGNPACPPLPGGCGPRSPTPSPGLREGKLRVPRAAGSGFDSGSRSCQDRLFQAPLHPLFVPPIYSCRDSSMTHGQPSPDPSWPTGAPAPVPWVPDRKSDV